MQKNKKLIPKIILGFLTLSFTGAFFILLSQEKTKSDMKPHMAMQATAPPTVSVASAASQTKELICITLGPLNQDKKAMLDNILKEEQISQEQILIKKKPVIEIFWNLGQDEKMARNLFNIQKQGAMQDAKFLLLFDEDLKSWIVSITSVSASIDSAKELTKSIAEKAKQIQSGGLWEFREKPPGYFYDFKSYESLSDSSIIKIDKIVVPQKEKCRS